MGNQTGRGKSNRTRFICHPYMRRVSLILHSRHRRSVGLGVDRQGWKYPTTLTGCQSLGLLASGWPWVIAFTRKVPPVPSPARCVGRRLPVRALTSTANAIALQAGRGGRHRRGAGMAVFVVSVALTDISDYTAHVRRSSAGFRGSSADFRESVPDVRRSSPDIRQSTAGFRQSVADFRRSSPDIRQSSPDFRRSPSAPPPLRATGRQK